MIRVSAVALVWIVSFVMMLRERYKEAYGYVGVNVICETILILILSGYVPRKSAFIIGGLFLTIVTTLKWKYEDIRGRSFFWDDDDLYFRGKVHFILVKGLSFAVIAMTQFGPTGSELLGVGLFYFGWLYISSEFRVARGLGVGLLVVCIGWFLYSFGVPHAWNICTAIITFIAVVLGLLSLHTTKN